MFDIIKPEEIEKRSFEIIKKELKVSIPKENEAVVLRVIHATADFDYAENLYFTVNAASAAADALKKGVSIVTDTNMAKAGINKKSLAALGGTVHCFMADEDVAAEAKRRGITRAAVSVEKAAALGKPLIFAFGNAPTALIKLHELVTLGKIKPEFIIAAPVGFVNVEESKELIRSLGLPCIIARGRKGGSGVAAAICNALIYMACRR
ncbi:MAG TPA: precorrin-8X methylmutase [Candidatus Ornithomonoglobus intestinigallinarum]|uniref:Precorrin-8X methylmutase n=1 Tax=Candidatus Ornithomonoglobus intestinigallinarum TaxID=2840894 RepID=A0A9D1KP00_9FIRM|nr:precorrin-8X methylmutase [Candidatus Ornithomonoglobus intestinigallinarum]